MMTVVVWILIVLLVISGAGLIAGVMMHSGKGTGVSDMLSNVSTSAGSTSLIEKNLDRITVVFAAVFLVDLLLCMLVYPVGTIV